MGACLWLIATAPHVALGATKSSVLSQIEDAKKKVMSSVETIDQKISQSLSRSTDPSGLDLLSPFKEIEAEVMTLKRKRRDYLAQRRFWDQLTLQVDRHFQGGDLKVFLSSRLLHLAQIELREASEKESLWRLMTYLAHGIQRLEESEDHAIFFFESYLQFGSPFDPPRPDVVLGTRHYSNARESVMASPIAKEDIGEIVEERLPLSAP